MLLLHLTGVPEFYDPAYKDVMFLRVQILGKEKKPDISFLVYFVKYEILNEGPITHY